MSNLIDESDSYLLNQSYSLNQRVGILSPEEIEYVVSIIKNKYMNIDDLKFVGIDHYEPSKESLITSGKQNLGCGRFARCVSMYLEKNETYIDIVNLLRRGIPDNNSIEKEEENKNEILTNVQPPISPDEYTLVDDLCKSYEPLIQLMKSKGLDPECIKVDPWCVGYSGPKDDPKERLCWPLITYQGGNDDIPYMRPFEGINMRVSLTTKKVIEFDSSKFDSFPIPPESPKHAKYVPMKECRKTVKPLYIKQPDGASFNIVADNCIIWEGWQLQVGFNAREGATLHFLSFNNRPVIHRLSMVEMVVPYGDPRKPHCLKAAFDAGEDGFGSNTNSLKYGCDCVGHVEYMDANIVSDTGKVETIVNAICIHEEDEGIAWKHTDWRSGVAEVRRARKLIISFITTIANYDYGFYYELHQDGSIKVDVKLTGVLSTGLLSYEEIKKKEERKYGTRLGDALYAPIHQHFFCARIDTAVDGINNRVIEKNVVVDPEDNVNNEYGNAFHYEGTVLETELQARRDTCSSTSRFWTIESSKTLNRTSCPTAYKLVPAPTCKPFVNISKSKQLNRASFLEYEFWVTAYNSKESYPGGEFPNQCKEQAGLMKWTNKDRSIHNKDIVLWYNFGVTHQPRLEDYPVMPVEHTGFMLKPYGFFDQSPVMDIKKSTACSNLNCE